MRLNRSKLAVLVLTTALTVSLSAAAVGANGGEQGMGIDGNLVYARAALSSSSGVSAHVTEPRTTDVEVSAEEQEDLETFARQRGLRLSQAQVQERYGWRDEFALAVTAIRERNPDSLAGSAAEAGHGFDAWIAFEGDAPAGVDEELAQLPVPVEVREGQGWSEPGLVEPAEQLHAAVTDHSDLAAEVATDPDVNSGALHIGVRPVAGLSSDEAATRLRDLVATEEFTDLIDKLPSQVAVEIRIDHSINSEPDTVYGGGKLRTCTAGFAVSRASNASQRGVTTADHCSNSQTYAGRSVLTYIGSMNRLAGDAQWHRSSEAVGAQFHYDTGSLRPQRRIADPVVGTPLCKYGISTRKTCDEVYRLNRCVTYDGVDYCGLAMTWERNAAGGDSGGPWYSGRTAFGIHSGAATGGPVDRDVFTPVREAHLRLGVILL